MSWFQRLTGFAEQSPEQVRTNLNVDGEFLVSTANGRCLRFGQFTTPTLADLRSATEALESQGQLSIRQVVANVESLHADPANTEAVFQVASQFNCLEMAAPDLTPEAGVGIYEHDLTQGPACAVSAGAATIYRNYFVPHHGVIGQSAANQIDCLENIGALLGNESRTLWTMQNGYCFPSSSGLETVDAALAKMCDEAIDDLMGQLMIGRQESAEVTIDHCNHTVTQIFGSALPVAYNSHPTDQWERFAKLVLDAAYEATFHCAVLNAQRTGCNKLFLTLLGGGVFGNRIEWILAAIERAARQFSASALDVAIVSHSRQDSRIEAMLANL